MSEEQNKTEQIKKPKTWDEAISELRGFIIQSRKEEAEKAKQESKEQQMKLAY